MNNHLSDYTGGNLNDIFSDSIRNSDFHSPMKDNQIMARQSLKQLYEECCTEADALGVVDELEDCLYSFLASCNRMNATTRKVGDESQDQDSTNKTGVTVPMTHAKYTGSSKRILNTHNYY